MTIQTIGRIAGRMPSIAERCVELSFDRFFVCLPRDLHMLRLALGVSAAKAACFCCVVGLVSLLICCLLPLTIIPREMRQIPFEL